tara:strand:- start:88 stop:753 length:666 start_codon:yes stop_codon:yes gene_type:complete
MKAMILAAGRGERMRELTRYIPKPLLEVNGKALIEHQLERLISAGFVEIVVNVAYLGDLIVARLGDGSAYGATIEYSQEVEGALGTGGGVRQALSLLGGGPIAIVNADVWSDYPYDKLRPPTRAGVHTVLVPNPAHVPKGDFGLKGGVLSRDGSPRYTFSGIATYDSGLFAGEAGESFSLVRVIDGAIRCGRATGELFEGVWMDVGTPQRYQSLLYVEQQN